MRIGIVTNYQWLKQWDNYGTLLQNFALQKVLQRQGHETFWILTVEKRAALFADGGRQLLLKLWFAPVELLLQLVNTLIRPDINEQDAGQIAAFNRIHPRHFREFFGKYVPHTSIEYGPGDLVQHPPEADAYIAGSDNIWEAVSIASFLQFGRPEALRIGYAVSAKWHNRSRYWLAKAKRAIRGFNQLSVREIDGIDVCRKVGRHDIAHVLDPTLLLEADDYRELIEEDGAAQEFLKPFVLGYFLNIHSLSDLPWNGMKDFADEVRAEFKVVPLQGAELVIPGQFVFTPSPAEMLHAIDKADCVLTNSFHGVALSIIMRKRFLVIPQNQTLHQGGHSRFSSLLGLLGLCERVADCTTACQFNEQMNRPIDWESAALKLKREREKSLSFLTRALEPTLCRFSEK